LVARDLIGSVTTAVPWDIATGLVMLFSRYLPIIALIAVAIKHHKSDQDCPCCLINDQWRQAINTLFAAGLGHLISALVYSPLLSPHET
jgi:K+-transporting ATPase A subunit